MTLKFKTEKIISVQNWDALVQKTYGRIYSFQQQDGCKDRGLFRFSVPNSETCDFEKDSIVEEVNGPDQGISFKAWLERDPKQKIPNQQYNWELSLFWSRNFYPEFQMVANDLNSKGLLPDGEYAIDIDW